MENQGKGRIIIRIGRHHLSFSTIDMSQEENPITYEPYVVRSGISMAANKVKGIRAAVVHNEFGAEMTRRHNHANVLCMGGRVTTEEDAVRFTDIFLNTPEEGGRHDKRVAMLTEIENGTFSV